DQGYFINMVQLPPGATSERTADVVKQLEQYYLNQEEVDHVIGVLGFSFFGRGQNAALVFVRLKDWDQRAGKEHSVQSVIGRGYMAMSAIKHAFIIGVNPPPIPELGTAGGFDFRLQDRSGQGREKLMEARNMLLGMAAQNPMLAGVRPEGQEPAPQITLEVDRV